MGDVEKSFLEALKADPTDDATRAVYADWLEEHGRNDRADYIRLQLRIRALDPASSVASELQRRVERLKRVLPDSWLDVITHPEPEAPPARVRVDVRPGPLQRPPRLREYNALAPPPPAGANTEVDPPLPVDTVASQLLGLGKADRARQRQCRHCNGAIGRWTSKCPHCGKRQLGFVTGLAFVILLVLGGVAFVDELRWQIRDDNFITGRRPSGC